MKVSIIINTYNRASYLKKALHSLQYLDYPRFEIIVVNGPSTDDTSQLLNEYKNYIKIGTCSLRNLSISRNIGIAMAAGDIVAFLDDDAIPEPEWLTNLVKYYDSPEVAGVGGSAYDNTGYEFQWRYFKGNRINGHTAVDLKPSDNYCFPGSLNFVALGGANCSFRRDLLLKIGGFDEQYDYGHDETDVCLRLIDAGYIIRYADHAYVHHKYAPSFMREEKVYTDFSQILKNSIYCIYKNYFPFYNNKIAVIEHIFNFIHWAKNVTEVKYKEKKLTQEQYDHAIESIFSGLSQGFHDSKNETRKLLTEYILKKYQAPFLKYNSPFETISKMVICLVTIGYPPRDHWGIARCTHLLANSLAKEGHHVHVICHSDQPMNTVDYEEGVWIHAIKPKYVKNRDLLGEKILPNGEWAINVAPFEEVKRINNYRSVDIIQVPIWHCEGIPFLLDANLKRKLLTSLYTTALVEKEMQKEWAEVTPIWEMAETIVKAEEFVLQNSLRVYANSQAIIDEVEDLYHIKLKQNQYHHLIPHSVLNIPFPLVKKEADFVDILFVGRLQLRKGIDILLQCIPELAKQNRQLRFIIIGDEGPFDYSKKNYKKDFLQQHKDADFLDRVIFLGHVSEEKLIEHYATCDLFVAPSRFESFGLIFLEAMRFAKPVIGCNAGGMKEIIVPNENGLLVEPNNHAELLEAIQLLASNKALRQKWGEASRKIYLERFSTQKLVEKTLELYQWVIRANELEISAEKNCLT